MASRKSWWSYLSIWKQLLTYKIHFYMNYIQRNSILWVAEGFVQLPVQKATIYSTKASNTEVLTMKAGWQQRDHPTSSYLLAGEPEMMRWMRIPWVTSGNDGSRIFSSVIILKEKKKKTRLK